MSGAEEADVLAAALAVLREDTRGAEPAAAATRRRILLTVSTQRRRRLGVLRVVVPLAAVLAIGTAWAAAGGRFAPVVETDGDHGEARSDAGVARATGGVREGNVDLDRDADADASADAGVDSNAGARAPRARTLAVTRQDREEGVYRVAHEAHFVVKDANGALVAWDAYLAAYPRGRFAPDARYNRALTLVRLGRRDEARTALEPFAHGPPGAYRQREARALLDAIGML